MKGAGENWLFFMIIYFTVKWLSMLWLNYL